MTDRLIDKYDLNTKSNGTEQIEIEHLRNDIK